MSNKIQSVLKEFSSLVKKEFSAKSRVILFGSYAKGRQKAWSDLDVAVILPKVKKVFETEKYLRIRSLAIDERINPFVFTKMDLEENSPLVWEIKQYGVEI